MKLLPWQSKVLRDSTDVIEVCGGRRIGKDFLLAQLAMKYRSVVFVYSYTNARDELIKNIAHTLGKEFIINKRENQLRYINPNLLDLNNDNFYSIIDFVRVTALKKPNMPDIKRIVCGKSVEELLISEHNPSREELQYLRKNILLPRGLKQTYILHNKPRDRKRYVVTTEEVNPISCYDNEKMMTKERYDEEFLVKQFKEVDKVCRPTRIDVSTAEILKSFKQSQVNPSKFVQGAEEKCRGLYRNRQG